MATVLWFRKGLRLHDNPALLQALKPAPQHLYPIFILDPWFIKSGRVGVNRIRFLLESLADLDANLRRLGSRLIVLQGSPIPVLSRAFTDWGVARLAFESDTEPYAKERDARVREIAATAGVEVVSPSGHTLYPPEKLLDYCGGKPPLTMQGFQKLLATVGHPAKPQDAPRSVPPPAPGKVADGEHGVPSLAELGLSLEAEGAAPVSRFPGGETEALRRMDAFLSNKRRAATFEKPKTVPTEFDPPATTVLSPHLKFGCLSPRTFYWRLQDLYREVPRHSSPPVSLEGQLLWREFFHLVGHATPNFDRMAGNPVCRPALAPRPPSLEPRSRWPLAPRRAGPGAGCPAPLTSRRRQIPWGDNAEYLKAWEEGRTGYPWIDAVMRQLRSEGWMHHLARHAVACFLTRGDLWVSWEKGAEVFDRLLLDADWHLNNGNWMWLSCSAFFHQFFRVYSPISFAKKGDPDGKFIRRYVPELARFPAQYIYEPWSAPLAAQQKAGCVVGKDYPRPIVDHAAASKRNMGRMKDAFAAARAAAGGGGGGGGDPEEEEGGEWEGEGAGKGKGKGKRGAPAPAREAKLKPAAGPGTSRASSGSTSNSKKKLKKA
eukprot:tig00000391_g24833.t1